jgi:mRNA interferase RelE/StbE
MKYEIFYANLAQRQLKKLPKLVAQKIAERIKVLADDMKGDVKKLTDHTPEYRLRVGDYRVLFDREGNSIVIQAVRNRKEAY